MLSYPDHWQNYFDLSMHVQYSLGVKRDEMRKLEEIAQVSVWLYCKTHQIKNKQTNNVHFKFFVLLNFVTM